MFIKRKINACPNVFKSALISLLILITVVIVFASFYLTLVKTIYADTNSQIIICINPGHGGNDHGATGPSGLKEKDVNLDIAFRLKDKLANSGFKVLLTREDDTKKSLEEIANFVNSSNANIFISIHNNSHTSREKNGTETFYYSQSPNSRVLASYLNSRVIEQIKTANRGVKASDFSEIKNVKMVSALVEAAFISNPDEEAKLNDAGFRDKIATGIYNGILDYLKISEKEILEARKLASAQAFVKKVYQKGLNIDPDAATINNWAGRLSSGEISYADVIKGIILSNQFNSRNLTDAQYINILYNTVLDRNPDPNGEAYWISQLKYQKRSAVLSYFLSSPEFNSLINNYIKNGYTYSATTANSSVNNINTKSEDTNISSSAFTITVLNGVGIKGIAAQTSQLVSSIKDLNGNFKYKVVEVADAKSFSYKNTQIICKNNNQEILKAADEIKSILKTGVISTRKGYLQVSDIVIIIGSDFSQSQLVKSSTQLSQYTINILNGQGTQGIAARLKGKIESFFNKDKVQIIVKETKNADNFNYKTTKIIIFTSKQDINLIAEDLKKYLGVGQISQSSNNIDNVDITIILGSDYRG